MNECYKGQRECYNWKIKTKKYVNLLVTFEVLVSHSLLFYFSLFKFVGLLLLKKLIRVK